MGPDQHGITQLSSVARVTQETRHRASRLQSQLYRIFRMYSHSHVVQLGDLPWALVLEAVSSTSPKPKGKQSQGQRVAPVALVTKPEEIVAR